MFRYDRLDELIKETGKKKNYLSIKMGYSSSRYLNDAKKQNTNIKGTELQILADELNTTPEYLTGESDIKEKSPAGFVADEAGIDYLLSKMSPTELAELMGKVAAELKERGLG